MTKSWFKSKAAWAAIITVLLGTIAPAIDAQLGTNLVGSPLYQVVITMAGALGFYGRKVASGPLK